MQADLDQSVMKNMVNQLLILLKNFEAELASDELRKKVQALLLFRFTQPLRS